jgi:2-polyprenyl-3-methyl-5-hydroxy-6-metoxy-1,4-benzoquinol methylase
VSDLWNGKDAKRWIEHVGTYGDPFQQRYIKAFILSCLLAEPNSPAYLNSLFPRVLHKVMATPIELLADTSTWKTFAAEFSGTPIDLSQHLIIDLGCGEGFIERFLCGFGATCVGLDYSAALIAEAQRKEVCSTNNLLFGIADLRKDFGLVQLIERLIAPRTVNDFKSLVVLSINVLDHIADPTIMMDQVRALCRQHPNATFVVSTFNPTFYLKLGSPLRVRAADFARQASFDVQLTMSRSTTHIFPRGWGSYSEFFSSKGFDIEYSTATDLDDFPEPIPDLLCPRAGGPFLLWRLIPVNEQPITEDELDKILSSLNLFSNLDARTSTRLRENLQKLSLRRFNPGDLVAMPGAFCRALSVVISGNFVVTIEKAIVQEFGPSTAFGDLESCRGFYAGRYLYEVRAGTTGGECLDIPTPLFLDLLTGSEPKSRQNDFLTYTPTSIGDRLFLSMRDRFNAHNPFYHRSIEVRPSQHPSYRVKTSRHFINNRDFSLRDIEHIIRCLVTLVTLQEEKFDGLEDAENIRLDDARRVPGLAVFINPKEIKIWLSGREPGAKERPFASELALLHKLGLIDAFSIPQIVNYDRHKLRNTVNGTFYQLVKDAVTMIVSRKYSVVKNEVPNERQLSAIILPNHIDQLVTSQIVRNLNSEAIRLTGNCAKAMSESIRSLELLFSQYQAHEAREIARAYYYNIAFLKWALFARDERRLIVIRDYPFFRRVTGGGLRWIEEMEARLELRDKMFTGERDWHHQARVENYLRYVSAYVLGHWQQGWDLDYSGPRSRKPEGSWRSLIQPE